MDPNRFDRLTLLIGSGSSRRQVLKTLASGALGVAAAAVGLGDAGAASRLRSVGNSCNRNSDCASGLCVQETRTRKICHCAAPSDCPAVTTLCHTAACLASGYCGSAPTPGVSCDDGNACTANDVCQADGSCQGTPVVCEASDQCHVAGTCDPASGQCSKPAVNDGTACGTNGACCSGACVDLTSDVSHCGSCAVDCSASGASLPGCVGGVCCEQRVAGTSVCSATLPCCTRSDLNISSCISGHCCVKSGQITAEAFECCSGAFSYSDVCA